MQGQQDAFIKAFFSHIHIPGCYFSKVHAGMYMVEGRQTKFQCGRQRSHPPISHRLAVEVAPLTQRRPKLDTTENASGLRTKFV